MRVFSGFQPTGELHLGNYFGAIRRSVELQDEFECIYSIVDYHAITNRMEGKTLARLTLGLAGDLLACGIDPERATLFVQSHVPEHTELAWIFGCVTGFGDLRRMTQFKDKSERAEEVSAGLFTYPVLQAADILLYRAERVPVGEDQLQHLELTRRIGRRFNTVVGRDYFPEVEPITGVGKRIMSLADPSRKMSKSLGSGHYVGLMEEPASVRKKIRSAVTDVGGEATDSMSPGVANLFMLLRLCAPEDVTNRLIEDHKTGSLRYQHLKDAVCEHVERTLAPIRERRAALSDAEIHAILGRGAERARAIAHGTMRDVRRLIRVGADALDRLVAKKAGKQRER